MAQVRHVPAHSLYPWSLLHGLFLPWALVTSLTDVSEHRRCSPGLPSEGSGSHPGLAEDAPPDPGGTLFHHLCQLPGGQFSDYLVPSLLA